MNQDILKIIHQFSDAAVSTERKDLLHPLIQYIQGKVKQGDTIRLNFICTHNSRRSHLSQIWAQTMAYHFGIKHVFCYSGGTEATALFPKVSETLLNQGFHIQKLSENANPVFAVKYADNEAPVVCFSKTYNDAFNPRSHYAAIMTCNSADEACPLVLGAEARFPIKYDDPKAFDGTELQSIKYAECSLELAREMWWVFKSVK
jgi:arsenate reductase